MPVVPGTQHSVETVEEAVVDHVVGVRDHHTAEEGRELEGGTLVSASTVARKSVWWCRETRRR